MKKVIKKTRSSKRSN